MKILCKKWSLLDVDFNDINIFSNSRDGKKLTITCDSEQDRDDFLNGFLRLLNDHTCESIDLTVEDGEEV